MANAPANAEIAIVNNFFFDKNPHGLALLPRASQVLKNTTNKWHQVFLMKNQLQANPMLQKKLPFQYMAKIRSQFLAESSWSRTLVQTIQIDDPFALLSNNTSHINYGTPSPDFWDYSRGVVE